MSQQPAPVAHAATAADARELSGVFRHIVQETVPSMVSIETIGNASQVSTDGRDLDSLRNHPLFKDFFKNDPRFRDLQDDERPDPRPQTLGKGSGFVIDASGIVVTNNHVVRGADKVKIRLYDGREFIATEVLQDPRSDVAVVRFDAPSDLKAVPLGNSDNAQIGDWVLAVGSPFGLDTTVTAGIISAKGRGIGINEREEYLQTDAAINPGNSGGPLINLDGEVVGINTAISSRSGGSNGVAFTIPINMAKWVTDQLVNTGEVRRAYLGVSISPVTSEFAEELGARVGQGAVVQEVVSGSPADEAGLKSKDVILSVNGQLVDGPTTLQGLVERLKLDESHELKILRDGEEQTLSLVAREMPSEYTRANIGKVMREGQEIEELGMQVRDLTPAIAKQLGLEDASGVVVTALENDGLAAAAGINAGDVIAKVGQTEVGSARDFAAAVKSILEGEDEALTLLVKTSEGTRLITIELTN